MPPHATEYKSPLPEAWVKEGDRYSLRGSPLIVIVLTRATGRAVFFITFYSGSPDAVRVTRYANSSSLRVDGTASVARAEVEALLLGVPVDEFVAALEIMYLQATGDEP